MGLHLLSRSVHPELLEKCASRQVDREQYVLLVSITTTGHWLSFRAGHSHLTEICTGIHQPLPNQGRLLSQAIDGQYVRKIMLPDQLSWECRFEIEVVNPKLFLTVQQQLAQQREFEGLLHHFEPSGRVPTGALSYINVQAFRRHVNVMTFHTFPDACSVIRAVTKIGLPG